MRINLNYKFYVIPNYHMKLTRREFVKLSGLVTVGTLVSYKARSISSFAEDMLQPYLNPMEERFIPSVCLQCPAGCGILVRVVNGKAVKIEGNPLSPLNRGGVCPKAHIGLHILYDPDRIKGPMIRNERKSNNWKSISWKEAIRIVAERLSELRKNGEPHKFVWMDGRVRGNMGDFISRFMKAYGSPNKIGHSNTCSDTVEIAHYLVQGHKHYLGYDFARTNYILVFGGGLIEAWRPTTRLLRIYGHIRRERANRVKIVVVDPRLTTSATKADEWLPIKPGTDGALALALANVIINEGLYDKDYVNAHVYGFNEYREIVQEYTPEWASKITGIPSDTIVRVAREFATTKPAIAAGQRGAMMWSNGAYNYMAIHTLNALVGSIGVPGGIIVQKGPPFKEWPEIEKDTIAEEGLKNVRIDLAGTEEYPFAKNNQTGVTDALLTGKPYMPKIVMTYYNNALFSHPEIERVYKAFEKVEFAISTSPFMSEFEENVADIILPEDTYLERWHDDKVYPSLGYPYAGMRQPVVEKVHDTQNAGDVLLMLAKELGELGHTSVARSMPWNSYVDVLKYRWSGIFESKRGRVGPIPVSSFSTFGEFWNALLKYGYWADPPYKFYDWEHEFKTETGKFEIYSLKIKHKLEELAEEKSKKEGISIEEAKEKLLEKWNIKARGDKVFLPHWEEPLIAGDEKEYPFILNSYKLMTHAEGRGANSPWMLEHISPYFMDIKYESWVEINPEDATRLGINNHDEVIIENPKGYKIKTIAILFEGARPGVVNMPFELGHKAYGRWARGIGANPNEVIIDEWNGKYLRERFSASVNYFATRVKIYRGDSIG
ncbi:MAG: hypothetical protein D6752_00465 [Candidatus Nitrosothermus koennekii]|nr:MAG: hypothetical protein D6752_00465 [Candidatus Nitrosothermus koennekii]